MQPSGDIYLGGLRISRLTQHILFWIAAYVIMVLVYGYSKTTYSAAARNNFFYIPVHVVYFYTLSGWLIPQFLLKRRYVYFFVLFSIVFFAAIYLTRFVDVLFVEPYLVRLYGSYAVWYDEGVKGFWDKVLYPNAFFGALKGVNFILWFGLAIKLFKLLLERRNAALEAELNFLKGQIHPHFLFNTLNNLYGLTLSGSDQSPQMVLKLSGILRYMLYECNTDRIELQKEVQMISAYIELEKIRYGERLDVQFSVNGDYDNIEISPLLILPFVENAFKHGTSEQVGNCWINIDLQLQNRRLKLKVSNSKPEPAEHPADPSEGSIGLKNVKKRLELLYPDAYKLKLFDEGELFLAVLELNLKRSNPLRYES
ncbi:histidine kinase [Arcticibacter tournemirensis]|uniref:Histidine kinase n=1 Tax=Arcticibacter tournemirensis TaxID=699437 RepID=A0A5M9GPP9_9SPHI|nr:histidine kinase [Arcticibacter tournemirensis]KAA8475717.1 histidine kinase [Arcticibacter tournemirensis]TQM52314.1 histidine kinase [Arcticibacter tournemirensis]